jgi:two-component system, chemotaxis family, sensor kinase CheA
MQDDKKKKDMSNNKKNMKNDNIEIIKEFVSESYSLLEEAERVVDHLIEPDNRNAVDIIFRLFHSIKGSASFLAFNNIKKITHTAENLLDLLRNNDIRLKQEDIGILYDSFNLLEKLVQKVNSEYTDEGYENDTNILVDKIRSCINKRIDDNKLKDTDFHRYVTQSKDLLSKIDNTLYKLQKDGYHRDFIFDILSNTYTLKMSLQILDYEDLWKLTSEVTNLLSSILSEDIMFDDETLEIVNLLSDIFHLVEDRLIQLERNRYHKPPIPNKNEIIKRIKGLLGKDIEPIRPIGEILVDMGVLDNQTIEEALRIQKMSEADKREYMKEITGMFKSKKGDIRVDTKKLDQLFDLVGELTTSSESIIKFIQEIIGVKNIKFKKLVANHSRVINGILSIVMSIRMVTLENMFTKMKRLVNQLSRKYNKKVSINIEGANTEIDKNLIEEISDPLVHLIRNAVDHGIEFPEDRKDKGKPETGQILLRARNEGNEIWITVKDDGKGLDQNKIIQVALKKGLIEKQDVDKMKEQDILNLVFEPGFSTVEEVSELSGRGVGMDVVKKNAEKIGGNVQVTSEKDKGTEFIFKIPLTIEIMEVMTTTIGGIKYSFPISDIIESLSLKRNKIEIKDDTEFIRLREEIIPLLKLNHEMEVNDKSAIIVLKKKDKKVCLCTDRIEGIQQTVIKPVPDYFGKLETIMGSSILGTGDITFIVDTSALIDKYVE